MKGLENGISIRAGPRPLWLGVYLKCDFADLRENPRSGGRSFNHDRRIWDDLAPIQTENDNGYWLCPLAVRGKLSGPLGEKAYLVVQVEERFRGGPVLFNLTCTGFRELLAHRDAYGSAHHKENKSGLHRLPSVETYHTPRSGRCTGEQAVSLQAADEHSPSSR